MHARAITYTLIAILAVGFLLRVLAFVETPVIAHLRADALQYYTAAHNVRFHGVYSTDLAGLGADVEPTPNAGRSPGYPLFLSLWIGPQPTQSVVDRIIMAQIVLGTLAVALAFTVAARLMGPEWGLVAALLTAFSPHLINIGLYVLTETLLTVVLLLYLMLSARLQAFGPAWRVASAAALLGYAALVHQTFEFLILPWAVLLILSTRGVARWRLLVAATLGFALVFGPWVVRNQQLLGTAHNKQYTVDVIHHGIYPDFMYNDDPRSFGYPYRADPRSPEIRQDLSSVLTEVARRFQEQRWRHLRWYLIDKPVAMWSWDTVQGMGDTFIYPVADSPYRHHPAFVASHRLMQLLHWPLVVLGIIGALLVWVPVVARGLNSATIIGLRTLSLVLLYTTALHMLGAPFPRYATPLRPLLFIMALLPFYLVQRRLSSANTGGPCSEIERSASTVLAIGKPIPIADPK